MQPLAVANLDVHLEVEGASIYDLGFLAILKHVGNPWGLPWKVLKQKYWVVFSLRGQEEICRAGKELSEER